MVALSDSFAAADPFSRLSGFVPPLQLRLMERLARGEEGVWFRAKAAELAARIEAMPRTGGSGNTPVAALRYFYGRCEWHIVELDCGAAGDGPEDFQSQVYGVANIGFGPEIGYISLPELFSVNVEIDLHWTPLPVSEILAGRG